MQALEFDRKRGLERRIAGVYIRNNKVLFDPADCALTSTPWRVKFSLFTTHLKSIARVQPLPDTFFIAQFGSTPVVRVPCVGKPGDLPCELTRLNTPVFSIAKRDEYRDILYPNMYFGNLSEWRKLSRDLLAAGERFAWRERQATAFWRGQCPQGKLLGLDRYQLVEQYSPSWLDVGFTRGCPNATVRTPDASYDLSQLRQHLGRSRPSGFGRHKYLIHMPGASAGSYSRNLQLALPSASAILVWHNPFYEFYYHGMRPYKHFVPVSAATLNQTVAILSAADEYAESIGRAGASYFKARLSADGLASYWKELLDAYTALLRGPMPRVTSELVDSCVF